jgi:hypothetical protein
MALQVSAFANAIMKLRDPQAKGFMDNRATNSFSRPSFLYEVDSLTLQNPVVLYVPSALTCYTSSFCPQNISLCFIWISIVPLNGINRLILVAET